MLCSTVRISPNNASNVALRLITDFVGYWPSQNTIVVGHQGTDPANWFVKLQFFPSSLSPVSCFSLAVLTDTKIALRPLSQNIFPGIPGNVSVHDGFADQHEITAPAILAEVKRLVGVTGTTTVTLVGIHLCDFPSIY